jgi:drug/metabolite transporter (DMT)-like permease
MTRARAGHGAVLGVAAPATFVLLWSTGFVGAKFGLPYAEPLTFLAVRLAIASAILALVTAATRAPLPSTAGGYVQAAIAGLLLHAGYLGGVFVAIDLGLPAGVAAVIVGLQPILTAALSALVLREPMSARRWTGVLLGFAGVGLVVSPGLAAAAGEGAALPVSGIAACIVALAATTAGTVYQSRHGGEVPLLSGTAVQYGAATVVLLAGAMLSETMRIAWTPSFIGALAWLVLVLSIGAVLLLLTLLRRGSATDVTALLYLVPPATALEAFLLFGERLDIVQLLGMALAVVGVACVLTRGDGQLGSAARERFLAAKERRWPWA